MLRDIGRHAAIEAHQRQRTIRAGHARARRSVQRCGSGVIEFENAASGICARPFDQLAIEPISPRIGGDGRLQDGGERPIASGKRRRIGGSGGHTSQRQCTANKTPDHPPPHSKMPTAHIAASKNYRFR
ncbi:hypothetical protein RugamoR57_27190 [Duganella caerulea]